MAIGNPITLTNNVASKTISVVATVDQTLFTVTGGYRVNQLEVFRNGVKLAQSKDFIANDGTSVTLTTPANTGDNIDFQIFDDFRVADAVVSVASSQTLHGNLAINGTLFTGVLDPESVTVGTITTITSGGINANTGIVTAHKFVGDGSGLTNVATNSVEGFTVRDNGVTIGIAKTIDFGGDLDVSPVEAGFTTVSLSDDVTIDTRVRVGTAITMDGALGIITATGFDATGLVTATTFVGNLRGNVTGDVTGNITGTAGTFNDVVKVGTAITADATSGIITATKFVGIITGTDATFTNVVKVGTAITADATSGIITATKFVGDGSELTGTQSLSVLTSDTDLENGKIYMLNASGLLLTLPASPSTGDAIDILNNVTGIHTVARNGSTIQSLSEDMEVNTQGIQFKISYTGSTWSLF